ncbi:MAG TPA: hypothetical protein PLM07_12300 [Candidatus Rifleibacterium sp.]|nr:hypothetical protein [Candidatus Rifleibacterium sp.]
MYSRHHYRREQQIASQAPENQDLKTLTANSAGPVAGTGTGNSKLRQIFYRLLLNLLPTALLIMTPAVEYACDANAKAIYSGKIQILAAITGVIIHLMATWSAGRAVSALAAAKTGQLVTWGEFARIRHPMTLSLIGQGLGGGLLLGMQLGWLLWAIASIMLIAACWHEDAELARRFPEAHAHWSRQVSAFIRFVVPAGQSVISSEGK